MKIRTSQALIMCPDHEGTIAYNFLKQTDFVCNEEVLLLLHKLNSWKPIEAVESMFPEMEREEFYQSIQGLIDIGALVVQDSPDAREERAKVEDWEWGIPSALFHYCEQNRKFVSRSEAEEMQRARVRHQAMVEPYLLNDFFETQIELPQAAANVTELMAKRRTQRNVMRTGISVSALSDCLFAGMGILDEAENCVGKLPLSMTPSGGARNPYEAYIYAPRVTGLDPGFYHYSAKEHSLAKVKDGVLENPSALIGDQPWINDMSCLVFLCADFRRTMWKYKDNNAYRVILIEAGHIGQNIMLAATEHGLTACPSAALAHNEISAHLQLDNALQSPVYALALGVPDNSGNQLH
ncbi:MAG: SagB/ThcOx family dehydrogenase [Rhizobiaceae bacterium]|nr:SagB/ThcOx family dehydrogenase [Rhizobiaceae bacterium]